MGPALRINSIRLQVRDAARSLAFYCDLFGMEEQTVALPSGRIRECAARYGASEPFTLSFAQAFHDPSPAPLEYISFEVEGMNELLQLYKRAGQLGAHCLEPRLKDGCWRACIFDPDGHKLEIVARSRAAAEMTPPAQAM